MENIKPPVIPKYSYIRTVSTSKFIRIEPIIPEKNNRNSQKQNKSTPERERATIENDLKTYKTNQRYMQAESVISEPKTALLVSFPWLSCILPGVVNDG